MNERSQVKRQLYLIIKDYPMVTECFGTDASHSPEMLFGVWFLFGACLVDMWLDAPENKGKTAPIQNRAIRFRGRFTPLCRSTPSRFQ